MTTIKKKALDPFFETSDDTEWNACVGPQGEAQNYVDGYLEAALELANAVIEKQLIASRDTLAMPILYNCRHGIELSLKYAINHLVEMTMLQQPHRPDHNIATHWNHLQSRGTKPDFPLGDMNLRKLIAEIEPYVKSLAAIDDDGQELRYAENRSGKQSLEKISLVNLAYVRGSIRKLMKLLKQLKERIHQLEEERATKTYTKDCSRTDLKLIAKIVGDMDKWADPSFDAKKTVVMELFGISSGKFSDAIDAIKKSGPLASLIGKEAKLHHLTDEKAIEVLKLWGTAHPQKKQTQEDDLGMDYFKRDPAKTVQWLQETKALDESIMKLVSLEELADLETVFYLGRDREFGEHYENRLKEKISTFGKALTRGNVHQIISKTNLLDSFAKGCESIGRPSLAEKVRLLRSADKTS